MGQPMLIVTDSMQCAMRTTPTATTVMSTIQSVNQAVDQMRTVRENVQMITNALTVSLMRIVLELMKCAMQPTQTATTAKEMAVIQVVPRTRTAMANAQMITNVLTVSLMRIVLELMKCAMQPTQTATTAKETAVIQAVHQMRTAMANAQMITSA